MTALFDNANRATVDLEGGEKLDVRHFEARDAMSELFEVRIVAVSRNLDVDFDGILGKAASFTLDAGGAPRIWRGIATAIDQVRVDKDGLATYELTIGPRAYLLSLRKNYRIFQFKSELDIVTQLLGEWGVPFRVLADGSVHKPRKFRAQYGESDLTFVKRVLEDAGISFWFDGADGSSTMVLDDQPASREVGYPTLRFHDQPGVTDRDFVTALSVVERVRPARRTVGDLDYRRAPTQQPILSATTGLPQELALEQYDYEPGAFLYVGGSGGNTPTADDRGAARTDESAGNALTKSRHSGARSDARRVQFTSNVIALGPGVLLGVTDHPHPLMGGTFLAVSSRVYGEHSSDWRADAEVVSSSTPYCPARVTPKPVAHGLESVTVVGPSSEEIHTDELGRVRVHFHWDRESKRNEESSCWVPTNQPWAGAGFGGTVLPRVGQEVLVEFLNGDPDRPVVVGRVYTERQPPPYPLPAGKKISGLVGRTSPAIVMGGAVNQVYMPFDEATGRPGSMRNSSKQLEQFKAKRPEEFPRNNSDNAFLLGDEMNNNLVFLQAKKDLHFVVKNAWKTVVGNYRGHLIDGNDHLHIRNSQFINVVGNQSLRINGDQTISVQHERDETVEKDLGLFVRQDMGVTTEGPMDLTSNTKAITIDAEEAILLQVGDSMIYIDKETVVVDSPRVDVNP